MRKRFTGRVSKHVNGKRYDISYGNPTTDDILDTAKGFIMLFPAMIIGVIAMFGPAIMNVFKPMAPFFGVDIDKVYGKPEESKDEKIARLEAEIDALKNDK